MSNPRTSARHLDNKVVLVVDDDRDARYLHRLIFEGCGAVVLEADSAPVALELLHQESVDAVVSDIGMPGYDGCWLAAHLREFKGATLPMLAITGYAQDYDERRCRTAGFNDYLTKPVEPDVLCARVASLLSNTRSDR